MSSLLFFVKVFFDRKDGLTAVEYAAGLSIIMVVGVASINALGGNFKKKEAPHSAAGRVDRIPGVTSSGVFELSKSKKTAANLGNPFWK